MILGRSTVQWTALITLTLDFILVVIGVAFTQAVGPATVILSGLGIVLAGYIAFIANTSTTPSATPKLVEGTPITVTNDAGAVIGHAPTPTPTPDVAPAGGPVDPEIPG